MSDNSKETTYIKVVLKPLAPYFFGNERGLLYSDNKTQMGNANRYFIQSNELPNQSALLGALRYLGIETPSSSYQLSPTDETRIGGKSFRIDAVDQSFGMIQKISPLYLMKNEDESLFCPAPFFISAAQTSDKEHHHVYDALTTDCEERWIPTYFREKKADFNQFISLSITDTMTVGKFSHFFDYLFDGKAEIRIFWNKKRQLDEVLLKGLFNPNHAAELSLDSSITVDEAEKALSNCFIAESFVDIYPRNGYYRITKDMPLKDIRHLQAKL